MKTTLDLPSDLLREVELRAVHEGRKLKDVVAEIIRRGLAQPKTSESPTIPVSYTHLTLPTKRIV